MTVIPYLTFTDEAEAAIALYTEAFGAEVEGLARFGDMPADPAMPVPPGSENRVLQAVLRFSGGMLRISDSFGEADRTPHGRVSIAVETDEAAIHRAYEVLAREGQVRNELAPAFFSPAYGSVTDRFGVTWELAAAFAA